MENNLVEAYYEAKSARYFSGVRGDYVSTLPPDPDASILEIGCGSGDTGAAVLAANKCRRYCGVELNKTAADLASQKISEVITGNVETITFPWQKNTFDSLIISEVLEHLIDPWEVLRRLHPLMKPGALVLASSPNISHYRIVKMLLSGNWNLEDSGPMDRSHLRWFTPSSFGQMFVSCGYRVENITPVTPMSLKTRILNTVLLNRYRHLFFVQINLRGRVEPLGISNND